MGAFHNIEESEFCLEGRFIDFVIKDGHKLKGLLIETIEGESYIKLAKHLRAAFDLRLTPGTWLQIVGKKNHDFQNGKVTLKAERVIATGGEIGKNHRITSVQELSSIDHTKVKSAKTKATILVCQKSDCMKRGGKEVCQALEAALSNRGLEDQVTIKGTGCMKNCKAGPNLVMPDKTRHSRIQAAQIPVLINKHFTSNTPLEYLPNNQHKIAIL